jgi:transposase
VVWKRLQKRGSLVSRRAAAGIGKLFTDGAGDGAKVAFFVQRFNRGEAVIADGYDSDPLIEGLEARDTTPVIPPPKAHRKEVFDFAPYCKRNRVEHFFNKIKHYRVIARHFDKLATTFLAGVLIVRNRRTKTLPWSMPPRGQPRC